MAILSLKEFMENYNFKNDTMHESELQRIYNYNINLRDSKKYSNKGFVKIDKGSMGGSHQVCFLKKD